MIEWSQINLVATEQRLTCSCYAQYEQQQWHCCIRFPKNTNFPENAAVGLQLEPQLLFGVIRSSYFSNELVFFLTKEGETSYFKQRYKLPTRAILLIPTAELILDELAKIQLQLT